MKRRKVELSSIKNSVDLIYAPRLYQIDSFNCKQVPKTHRSGGNENQREMNKDDLITSKKNKVNKLIKITEGQFHENVFNQNDQILEKNKNNPKSKHESQSLFFASSKSQNFNDSHRKISLSNRQEKYFNQGNSGINLLNYCEFNKYAHSNSLKNYNNTILDDQSSKQEQNSFRSQVYKILQQIQSQDHDQKDLKKKVRKVSLMNRRQSELMNQVIINFDGQTESTHSLEVEEEFKIILTDKKRRTSKHKNINIEGFRLKRSDSKDDKANKETSKNNQLPHQFSIVSPAHKRILLKDQVTSPQNKDYSNGLNRLGMEKWKTSKFILGEFMWNTKIQQLKADIKNRMPAYSTKLLKEWESTEIIPETHRPKLSLENHSYISPTDFKKSFCQYSPADFLLSHSSDNFIVPVQEIYPQINHNYAIQPSSQKNSSSSYITQKIHKNNRKVLSQTVDGTDQFIQFSPYSTSDDTSLFNYSKETLPTNQKMKNCIDETKMIQIHKQSNFEKADGGTTSQQKNLSSSNRIDYKSNYLNLKSKYEDQKKEAQHLSKEIQKISKINNQKAIVSSQLIQTAKKQSNSTLFEIINFKKEKSTLKNLDQTPCYQVHEQLNEAQIYKKMKQRANTYKTFKNNIELHIQGQKKKYNFI